MLIKWEDPEKSRHSSTDSTRQVVRLYELSAGAIFGNWEADARYDENVA
jgi:hypothetical protein